MDIRTIRDSIDIQVHMILTILYASRDDLNEEEFILKAVKLLTKTTSELVYQELLRSGALLFPAQWDRIQKLVVIS